MFHGSSVYERWFSQYKKSTEKIRHTFSNTWVPWKTPLFDSMFYNCCELPSNKFTLSSVNYINLESKNFQLSAFPFKFILARE